MRRLNLLLAVTAAVANSARSDADRAGDGSRMPHMTDRVLLRFRKP